MGGLGLYSSGNAWTEKDREDLFTRRKNGEDWVSICQVSWQFHHRIAVAFKS